MGLDCPNQPGMAVCDTQLQSRSFRLKVGDVHIFPLCFLLHLLHEPMVVNIPGGDLEAG